MANNVGVTGSSISGNTLTVTFGITGDSDVSDTTIYLDFDATGIASVNVSDLAGFTLFLPNENDSGQWTIGAASLSPFSPGTDLFSVELVFSSVPSSLEVNVDGSFGATNLVPVDVIAGDGFFNTLPFGDVSISGTPAKGEMLTASNTLDDFDGNGSITYQWQANGVDIDSATGATLLLSENEVGKAITVTAIYTDGADNEEYIESAPTVLVAGGNSAPSGTADVVAATEDTEAAFLSSILLSNDTDPDGDDLTLYSVSAVSGGSVTLDGGSVIFEPFDDFNGVATFTYVASDGNGGYTADTTVTVNVAPVNDTPVGVVDTVVAVEDTETTFLAASLLSNDTDSDGDDLTLYSVSAVSGGSVFLDGGNVVFIPNDDFNGLATFRYVASDGNGGFTADTTVTVDVASRNDAPVGVADTVVAVKGTQTTFLAASLLSNDTDSDGDDLTLYSVSAVSGGSVILDGGNVVFTPSNNFDSSATFTYVASDGNGGFTADTTVNVSMQDLFAPVVTAVIPEDGAFDVPLGSDIEISFDESVVAGDGYILLKTAWGDLIEEFSTLSSERVTIADNTVTLDPAEDLMPKVPYIVELQTGAVQDLSGNVFAEDVDYSFATYGPNDELPLPAVPGEIETLVDMYIIIAGRAPDATGLTFWSQVLEGSGSLEYTVSEIWASNGAQTLYPSTMSSEEVISTFYTNIYSEGPEQNQLDSWVNFWDTNGPINTLLEMIDSIKNWQIDDPVDLAAQQLFEDKEDLGIYFAISRGSDDLELAKAVFTTLENGADLQEAVYFTDYQLDIIGQPADSDAIII